MEPFKKFVIIVQNVGERSPRAFGNGFVKELPPSNQNDGQPFEHRNIFEFKNIPLF